MADRLRQIVQLLESRYDFLWLPNGSLRTQPGLAPGKSQPCVTCGGVELRDDFGKTLTWRKGSGRVKDRFGRWHPCPGCGGDGQIARDRMDATRAKLGSEMTSASARPRRTVTCDRCGGGGVWKHERCGLCDGSGKRDQHRFDLHIDVTDGGPERDPVAEAISRRDRAGSYHELDVAVAGIRAHVNKPLRFHAVTVHATRAVRLLDECYLPPQRDQHTLTCFERELLDLTLAYLDSRMPDPIRVPAEIRLAHRARVEHLRQVRGRGADPNALRQRDDQARRWAREGRPYPWIGQQLGLSDRQLREIINRPRTAA